MARPRIFVSSTFFDLKQVRADLEYFIKELGYEAILNERGAVPYGAAENPEEYAYREVELSDVLVSIIGSRYGSPSSSQSPYSISQAELKTAIRLGKQVYVFVERAVLSEYATFMANKEVPDINYAAVDDVKVFQFLDELEQLPKRNPTAPFETARDITDYLREQWAGLFQRMLQEQTLRQEVRLLDDMQNTVRTLNGLVTFLTEERRNSDHAIQAILLSNHPAFQRFREALNVPYRVFFTNLEELNAWLAQRLFTPVEEMAWDGPSSIEWWRENRGGGSGTLLKVDKRVFDEKTGRLNVFTDADWDNAWVEVEERDDDQLHEPVALPPDDDLPF